MKYGLHFINAKGEEDWLRESSKDISTWESSKDADDWRKNHTVNPNGYEVRKVTPKIIKSDIESFK
jgi:hypothetical protein